MKFGRFKKYWMNGRFGVEVSSAADFLQFSEWDNSLYTQSDSEGMMSYRWQCSVDDYIDMPISPGEIVWFEVRSNLTVSGQFTISKNFIRNNRSSRTYSEKMTVNGKEHKILIVI